MLREMKIEDAQYLVEINTTQLGYQASFQETVNRMNKLLNDPRHHSFLVYEQPDTKIVCGYVHAEIYESLYSEPLFNLMALAVAKEFEGQGIGKCLMSGIESEALKRGLKGIRLNSGKERTRAHFFYEKIGYDSNKIQKRFMKKL
ncbi:GNAT family N-acetyltransferase [Enterococcus sp. LJL98]